MAKFREKVVRKIRKYNQHYLHTHTRAYTTTYLHTYIHVYKRMCTKQIVLERREEKKQTFTIYLTAQNKISRVWCHFKPWFLFNFFLCHFVLSLTFEHKNLYRVSYFVIFYNLSSAATTFLYINVNVYVKVWKCVCVCVRVALNVC